MVKIGNFIFQDANVYVTMKKALQTKLPDNVEIVLSRVSTAVTVKGRPEVVVHYESVVTDDVIDDFIEKNLKFIEGIKREFAKYPVKKISVSSVGISGVCINVEKESGETIKIYLERKSISINGKRYLSLEEIEKYLRQ